MIRRPPRSTLSSSSAASDVYKRQVSTQSTGNFEKHIARTHASHFTTSATTPAAHHLSSQHIFNSFSTPLSTANMDTDGSKLELYTPWTWWEHEHSGDYNLQALGTCDNIATFWQYFNNIPQPHTFFTSKAAKRKLVGRRKVDALSLFREGVKPEWEDPRNSSGGEVLFRSDKLDLVNSMWYELALAVVGQVLPMEEGEILGVRVLDKTSKSKIEYRIEVWYSEGVDAVILMEQLQSLLSGLQNNNLNFSVRNHSSTLQKTLDKGNKGNKGKPDRKGGQPTSRDRGNAGGDVKLPAPADVPTGNQNNQNVPRAVHVG
eukprot:TRINITY_DN26694_c0_g1_i1.p1 TRINITY_DN26694_c0_g1~~TRINITY_DN26694_c0_g1_i1.p1  ORF type:complete len:317 (-),score=70.19 TRINITY_DN26694_c0_g1_i1:445-1395(-)